MTTARLGDVASFIRGITFKPNDVVPLGSPGAVGCMRTKNVQADLDLDDVWSVPESLVPRGDQMLRCSDVLVSSANSWNLVGKCSWVPELPFASSFGGFVTVLRSKSDKLDSRYLYRWFSSTRLQTLVRSFGRQTTNISNLDIQRCRELEIFLPLLSDQRRIAAILDQADALRAKRREALAQLDNFKQSIFIQTFRKALSSPDRLPLAQFVEEFRYGTSNKSGASGFPTLRIPNVANGYLDLNELKKVAVDTAEFERLSLQHGDLLFVRTNGNPENVGRCAIFDPAIIHKLGYNSATFIYASYLIRTRLKPESIIPVVLQQYLHTGEGRHALRALCKTSAGQYNINTEGLRAIPVPHFQQDLQHAYADHVKSIETLKATNFVALAESEALFTSLQHRAFQGEL